MQLTLDNSLLLAGTAAAVLWANLVFASYDAFAHPLHFWVNDVGMVFFFALAAKEVFEATLPGGRSHPHGRRRRRSPQPEWSRPPSSTSLSRPRSGLRN